MRPDLPSGTVTFLFTDVEGSTRLLREMGAEAYAGALDEHRRSIRTACAGHGGIEVDTQGDAFFFAFPTAPDALAAAASATEALAEGSIRVRMGIHTGTPHLTDEGYVGDDVHLAARIAAAGHGGQVLVSVATRRLVDDGWALTELGEHRLKDIEDPIAIFQVGDFQFPPLSTVSNTNLPHPASSFVGRDRELAEVVDVIGHGARLLTLTGPGGAGKTRLAIEAASELVPATKAGVYWVALATLRDPTLVKDVIAQSLGAKDGLAAHIAERDMLLVLDNLEQVVEAGPELAALVEACPNLRLLVTSRERLRVRGEVEYVVPPLSATDAVALFCERSGSEPSAEIATLCRRLDDLPLAVELAAARMGVLTAAQILDRISMRLDLLKGGRDADARQLTLRATIGWSHDLLEPEERRVFARLAVFRGGCTLDAAEAISGADIDSLQALVDKSLLRSVDGRYAMLETIREYAAEQLAASGEEPEVRSRFVGYYRELAMRMDARLRRGEPEEGPVEILEADIDNLRAALDTAAASGDADSVGAITLALPMYWEMRGPYAEGRSWIERSLAMSEAEDDTRRRLLSALGTIAYIQGDLEAAVAATDEAAALATRLGGATERLDLLREQAAAVLWIPTPDYDEAERLYRARLEEAIAVDNGVVTSACRLNLAYIATRTKRYDLALAFLAENLSFVRSKGQARCEAATLAGFADTALARGRPTDAEDVALAGARIALQIRDDPQAAWCLDAVAPSIAVRGEERRAVLILAATEAARERMGAEPDEDEVAIRALALAAIGDAGGIDDVVWAEGRALDLAAAWEVAAAPTDALSAS